MQQTIDDDITIWTPSAALEFGDRYQRFLQLRRLMLAAKSAQQTACAANHPTTIAAIQTEARAFYARVDELAEDVWSTPAVGWPGLLERAELAAFHRPFGGTICARYDRAADALISSVFEIGGRHG